MIGTEASGDWLLRRWRIVREADVFDPARFTDGIPLALAALPVPARTPTRAGLGFQIEHQGASDYLVMGWWDNENELPLRVFVRDAALWRAARGSESICVWDLEVLAAERAVYIETMLGGRPDPGAWKREVPRCG